MTEHLKRFIIFANVLVLFAFIDLWFLKSEDGTSRFPFGKCFACFTVGYLMSRADYIKA